MDLNDVTAEKFFKRFTYSSDPDPENKIVLSNGTFVQSAVLLKMVYELEKMRTTK